MPLAARTLLAHRYFFALKPDEVTARRTDILAQGELGALRRVRPEHHHLTLAITDDFHEPYDCVIEALLRAGDAVAAAPFVLELDRLSAGGRSLALRPSRMEPGLRELQRQIVRAMACERLSLRRDWRFSPHQTLGYREGDPFTRSLPAFRWHASEFVLVHSLVGLTRHEILGRWPLRAALPDQYALF